MKQLFRLFVAILLSALLIAGVPTAAQSEPLTPVTLFLGYIQNIQFAPIYVAMERGYFNEAGIELTLEYSFNETDGITRLGTNNLQFALVSGEQTMLARAQGAPLRYVFRWYQKFPIGVVVPAGSDIEVPADLQDKVVGVPGKFGASYTGLQALLASADLTEADLQELKAIGFETAPIVCSGQVDASVVYVANEPESIRAMCFDVRVIPIADYANLVSNGLVTNEETIEQQPELVRGMAQALAKGLADTIDDPDAAMKISANGKYVEGLTSDDEVQLKVLTNSIELWKADTLGASDEDSWQLTADTLRTMGLLSADFNDDDLAQVWTNDFLE